MSNTTTPVAPERFQSREQLDQYIEQQTAAALEKAVGSGQVRVDRRVPWVTSGPVGQVAGLGNQFTRGLRRPGIRHLAPEREEVLADAVF